MNAATACVLLSGLLSITAAYYATKWKIAAEEACRRIAFLEERNAAILRCKYVQFITDKNLPANTMYMLLKGDGE